MKANSKASKEDIRDLCWTAFWESEDSENLMKSVFKYWFANNYVSLRPLTPAEREARKAQRQVEIEQAKTTIKQNLLDLVLPNGKRLRDCTGRDCTRLSKKIGPWLMRIAEKVKPNEIVGKVLTEAQVQSLYV
jgi:hypothetical protein